MNDLLNKIENNKPLDFGDIISRAIELFKKTWLQGLILVILLMIMIAPFFVAIYIPMLSSISEQIESGGYDPNDASNLIEAQSTYFQYMILGVTFILGIVNTGLVAGFYRIIKCIDFGEPFSFADFFALFRPKYLGKLFAIAAFSLLIALINLIAETFLPQLMASLLNIGLSIILSVYTTLFVVFFAFNSELEASDIFVLSFRFGSKKWLVLFGLLIVTGIMGMLGVIACFIGIIFTISIVYLPVYLVYKDIFGFDEKSEIEQIGIE